MSIQKLKIATYCIAKRMQGYQLLRNPKGAPATTVKVIKYSDNINPKTLDISKSYETISKDFTKYKEPETTKNLDIEKYAFFNSKTGGFKIKKQVDYIKHMSDYHFAPTEVSTKGLVPREKLVTRNLEDLQKVVVCSGYRDRNGNYTVRETTRADVVLKAYNSMKASNEERIAKNRPNFWQTLFYNLTQK